MLLLDATQGITEQDAHIAGYILEAGRALVVGGQQVGRASTPTQRDDVKRDDRAQAGFPRRSRRACTTSRRAKRQRHRAGDATSVDDAYAAAMAQAADAEADARAAARRWSASSRRAPGMVRPKLRYAHQGGMNPPLIVIHGNALEHVPDAYRRYLEHFFRDAFKLRGHAA